MPNLPAKTTTMVEAFSADDIVKEAREWIGTPYHHQMSVKGVGCDCLGLVRGIFRHLYGWEPEVPPYSSDWGDSNNAETLMQAGFNYLEPIEKDKAEAGDVVGIRWKDYRVVKHVLVLTSLDTAIHAYNRSTCKEITLGQLKPMIAVAFRFPKEGS